MIPTQYRTVAFTDVPVPLDEESLRAHLLLRAAYRRTRYVVARNGSEVAVVELVKAAEEELFEPIVEVRLLAGPRETVLLDRPDVDTAVPSQLARVAEEVPNARCVVVHGRYQHVNFVLDPHPRRVHVLDVAPPWPAKLVDQVHRVADTAEDLPATLVVPEVIDLQDLVSAAPPAGHYLMPCRGGGVEVPGATISYLDQVPTAVPGWTLVGCTRSRQIHDHFYPELAAGLDQIDICPLERARLTAQPGDAVRLTKCCQLEDHIETQDDIVVVPWGSSFELVREGLYAASDLAADRDRATRSATP